MKEISRNISQRRAGVILSYISETIKIISALIYTPIMIRLLGQSEYGLYQLVHSVVSYLGLLSLGFSSSYVRFYSQYKANDNQEEISRLNGMFMTIFLVIAGISLLCGFIMITNIQGIFKDGLTTSEYPRARILMIIMVMNLALSFPNSVFNSINSAHERFLFQRTVTIVHNILNPFLSLPLLLMGYGSVGMVCATTVTAVLAFMVNWYYVINRLQEKFIFNHFNLEVFHDIWRFTFFIFLNQVIDQVNWSVDKFLLGRMIGTTAVAVYGLGGQINTLYVQFATSVSTVFIPKVNRIVAENGSSKELTALFIKIGRIQFLILALVLSGFIFFGKPFMRFWGGEGYGASYYVALWLITPVTVPLIQNLGIAIQRAKNKHQTRSLVYAVIAVVNILISIPLIRWSGPVGAAVGTALSLIGGNIVFMNWYYNNRIRLDIISFWKSIASFFPALAVPLLTGTLFRQYYVIDTIQKLLLCITGYTILYSIFMYFFGLNESEKKLVETTFRLK